jgi:predicted GIY-YIG superfamily endonuclease
MTAHYVYRCYDAAGQLLYVGCSKNPQRRIKEHTFTRTWWTDRIARVVLKVFPDRLLALLAEEQAIKAEHPIHNRQFRSLDSERADWQPEHYINWLTALLEDPASSLSRPIVQREVKRAADDYSRRFGRDLRKDVGRVRVGYRRSDAVAEAKWGPELHPTPKWRVA